jgi:hypothetical protein
VWGLQFAKIENSRSIFFLTNSLMTIMVFMYTLIITVHNYR